MTQNEILEGNKLIAEFMELKQEPNNPDLFHTEHYYETDDGSEDVYGTDEVKYHSSWDWLMPVVEKINTVESYGMVTETMKNIGLSIPDIKLVYYFVIKFIKWHNKNK